MTTCSITWLLILKALFPQKPVTVNTNYGAVNGFTTVSDGCIRAQVFLGIPFAKPPIDNLRFEKPQRPDKWKTAIQADYFRSSCIAHDRSALSTTAKSFNEDCLYLNVITPILTKNNSYPVMVWIHGGGYQFDSASSYRYNSIINNFISRGVIIVTVEYRLGFFGFMSTGDSVMPGNLGLWDQTAALEFVKENIMQFGGDPNRITIFGLSAGGSSVSALALSPYSRDLFNNVIQMSGSSFSEWSSSELVDDASRELAEQLKCNTANTTEMKNCLKNRTVEEFWDAVNATGRTRDNYKIIKYGPRVDGEFFPKNLELLLKEAPRKPTITGMSANEGILFGLMDTLKTVSTQYIPEEEFSNFNDNKLIDIIRTKFATVDDLKDEAEEVQELIINYYVRNNATETQNSSYWLKQYTKLLSDVMIGMAVRKETELKIQNDWPVWQYVTDYYNPLMYPENFPVKAATHAGEEAYLFSVFPVRKFVFDDNDKLMQSVMLDSFTNFAKTGQPSVDSVIWEMATKENPTKNLRFRPQPQMDDDIFNKNYDFWKLLENYNYNIITGKSHKVELTTVAEIPTIGRTAIEEITTKETATLPSATTVEIPTTSSSSAISTAVAETVTNPQAESPAIDAAVVKSSALISLMTTLCCFWLLQMQQKAFLRM